jgi:carboxymethylenebutenolidase
MCLGSDCDDAALDRRRFISGATWALAGLAASARSGQPPPTRVLDDSSVGHGRVEFAGVGGYLARRKTGGRAPAVLVVAGNLITEEYIPNTCAALAVAGFVGLAPDIFHVVPPNASPAQMNAALAGRTDKDYLADIRAGAQFLRQHEAVATGTMGILGFCSGGRRALLYAAAFDGIGAVVSFHAASMTTPAEIASLGVPTQFHHGTGDKVSPSAVSLTLEKALRARGTAAEAHLYEGADHGFLAYTREPEYDAAAATLAWSRTIAFLKRHLSA